MKKRNTRADAASVLSDLLSQHGSLTSQLDQFSKYEDFPLLQEICFGVCRHYFVLQSILTPLLAKPLRAKDRDIQCLLLVGIYQLRNMRVPDHAAVNETVAATRFLKKPWAKGLVNAVLRKVLALPEVSQTSDESRRNSDGIRRPKARSARCSGKSLSHSGHGAGPTRRHSGQACPCSTLCSIPVARYVL